jgi:hypothetical protein
MGSPVRAAALAAVFGLAVAAAPGCRSPEPNPQQAFLSGLAAQDAQIARFQLDTGRDGRTAYLDVLGMEPESSPIAAVRAFLLVARQYEGTPYELFELRYRGQPRLRFVKADVLDLTRMHGSDERSLTVLREVLARARPPRAEPPAERRPARSGDGGDAAGALRAFTSDMQGFLDTWFLADVRRGG